MTHGFYRPTKICRVSWKNRPIFVARQKSADDKSFQTWLKTTSFVGRNPDLWLVRDIVYKKEIEWKEEAILKLIELYEKNTDIVWSVGSQLSKPWYEETKRTVVINEIDNRLRQ